STKSGCPSPFISAAAITNQPENTGRVGPNLPKRKLLLFMYQIAVWLPRGPPWSTRSGCPSPLKSATAIMSQFAGRLGPFNAPTKLLLFMYQIPVSPPNGAPKSSSSTKSGCPSPLKSATPRMNQSDGRVGPNNAPTKLLLFMYQIPVCWGKGIPDPPWSTKSGL